MNDFSSQYQQPQPQTQSFQSQSQPSKTETQSQSFQNQPQPKSSQSPQIKHSSNEYIKKPINKKSYIIIALIMISIIIIYTIWIFVSYKNKTGFFEPYVATYNEENKELYNPFKKEYDQTTIDEYKKNKTRLICNGCKTLIDRNNILSPVLEDDGTPTVPDNITSTGSFCSTFWANNDCNQYYSSI
jgi:hypothetical protein